MQLSLRLKNIAKMVDKSAIVADVGCDHALLSIYLVQNNITKKVYAIDNKKEPLQGARKNIAEYGMSSFIETYLQNGLTMLKEDVDTVIMAGIGGLLAIDMLKNASFIPNTLIIQANNHLEELREFLVNNNLKIVEEKIVFESDIYYEIIKINKGNQILTKEDVVFGPYLRENKSELFIDKWNKMLAHYKYILSKHSENDDKLDKIKDNILMIEQELKRGQ